MTNVMAVKVGYTKDKGAVYLFSDSQSTGGAEKSVVQKLYSRGGCLVAGTGLERRQSEVVSKLSKIEDSNPEYVSQKILEIGERFKFRKPVKGEPEDHEGFIVVGMQKGEPSVYSIHLSRDSYDPDSGLEPVMEIENYFCFKGSGTVQTRPAIVRDFETGNIWLPDIEEGLAFCFSYGDKAGRDIWVDERLQIGLVTPDFTRLLYHPTVPFDLTDFLRYINTNLGLKLSKEDYKVDDNEKFNDVFSVLNDLYQAFMINCKSMEGMSRQINAANTRSSAEQDQREKHEKERLEHLPIRDRYKSYVKELIDSWISGDISKISEAVEKHHERRRAKYKTGIEFIETLKNIGDKK